MTNPSPAGAALQLRVALGFLTRLPVGAPGSLAAAAWAFPVVGLLVGLVAAMAYQAALWLSLPPLAAAILAVTAGLLVTGALHEDGLADLADGFGGGRDRAAKLAIMRDSRIGSFGVLALLLSVLLRVAALAALPSPGWTAAALIAGHALSRAPLPAVMLLLPPARADGLAVAAGRPAPGGTAAAALIGLAAGLLALGLSGGLAGAAVAAVAALGLSALARRQIGGQTGDVLGAVQQVAEAGVLLAVAAMA
jgi:adenosylcobinamide-GDP ribazoletransferase